MGPPLLRGLHPATLQWEGESKGWGKIGLCGGGGVVQAPFPDPPPPFWAPVTGTPDELTATTYGLTGEVWGGGGGPEVPQLL